MSHLCVDTTPLNVLLADMQVHLVSIICTAFVLFGEHLPQAQHVFRSTASTLWVRPPEYTHIQTDHSKLKTCYTCACTERHVIGVCHSAKAYTSSNTC